MANLKVDQRQVGTVLILYPHGYIDAHTVKDFESELQSTVERGECRILINGKDLTYIASAGLGALMGMIEDVRSREGDIRLTELNENVYSVFDILGFTHLFQIFRSEDEALQSFR